MKMIKRMLLFIKGAISFLVKKVTPVSKTSEIQQALANIVVGEYFNIKWPQKVVGDVAIVRCLVNEPSKKRMLVEIRFYTSPAEQIVLEYSDPRLVYHTLLNAKKSKPTSVSPISEDLGSSFKTAWSPLRTPEPSPAATFTPSLESLEKDLKSALKAEKYDDAAKLRDLIAQRKKEQKQGK